MRREDRGRFAARGLGWGAEGAQESHRRMDRFVGLPGSDPHPPDSPGRSPIAAHWVALGAIALAGTILLFWFTRRGIGLWEDTFDYVTSALNLARTGQLGRVDGLGEFRPLTHFPPGYPMALGLLSLLGVDIYVAARWLSCVMFGATVGLVGATTLLMTESVIGGLLAAALVLTSEVIIGVHLWALSEPLYLFLSLLTLIVLSAYLRSPRRSVLLWAAASAGGLALLTRFVGVSLVLAAVVVLVAFPHAPLRRRLRDTATFSAVAFLPIGAFLLRNLSVSGNAADLSQPSWHLPAAAQWQEAARTLLNWGLPDFVVDSLAGDASLFLVAVPIILGVGGVLWFARRELGRLSSAGGRWPQLTLLSLSYGTLYALTVLGTVALVHRNTPLDDRILSPLYPTSLVLASGFVAEAWKAGGVKTKWAVATACILLAAFQLARFRGLALTLPSDSRGFASNAWQTSETAAYVRGLPQLPIYSNEIQALYFLAGKNAAFVPTSSNPATGERRGDYEVSLARMRERLGTEGGFLVLIDPSELSPEEMSELVDGLILVATFSDGVVYRSPTPRY